MPQRFPERGNLQRMGQSCADKIALIQRKDLCLILKTAKRGTSDNAMIVFFKFTAQVKSVFDSAIGSRM